MGCIANVVMHVGESEGGLVPLSTIKKPTSVAAFLNWIVNDWCLNQGSIPCIHIREGSYLLCKIGNLYPQIITYG